MKAIAHTRYGSPEVLQLKEVEKPAPAANEVLVKIHAAAANAEDWRIMRAAPFFVRFEFGLSKPKSPMFGADIAGTVEAVGSSVTQFKPGDEVFADLSLSGHGAYAEYKTVPEHLLALKPDNLTFEQAAAIPLAGITALQGLRDNSQLQAGQRVLINGASGGVGTFAVQIAKAFGAEVTGVCSTRNLELVRSIGADHVVDYTQADFTRNGQRYDQIFDVVGNRSVSDLARALCDGGKAIVAGFTTLPHLIHIGLMGAWTSRTTSKHIAQMGAAKSNQQDLNVLRELIEAGKVTPVIDRTYPLSKTPDAIRYLEQGHARGKVVVTVV